MSATVSKPSALDALKSLANKKAAPSVAISTQLTDPAIAGATKGKGSNSVVNLGFDPTFADKAAQCAALKSALDQAAVQFEVLQTETRDYGAKKREIYNSTFHGSITTVKVPFEVDTPTGKEKQYISVVCQNRYSVQPQMVLGAKDSLGDAYGRLFVEEVSKTLKPNAEDLIRGILAEVGLTSDQVEASMENLFDTTVKVKASENYEQEVKKVPEELRAVLTQCVTRAQPGLKF
jgi:hypothetical protein